MSATPSAELTECLGKVVPPQARSSHRRFPRIGVEDFEQEMWLRALTSLDRFEHLVRTDEGAYALIGNELRRACTRLGQQDNRARRAAAAAAAGYSTYDEYFYDNPKMVGHLLSELLESEWDLPFAMDRATKGTDLTGMRVQGGDDGHDGFMDYLTLLVDVRDGYEALNGEQQRTLTAWYGVGADLEDGDEEEHKWDRESIAGSWGISYDALRMRKNRAMVALTRELGGDNPWQLRERGDG